MGGQVHEEMRGEVFPEDGVGDLGVGEGQVLLADCRKHAVVDLQVQHLPVEVALP